jgi:predicted nucleotidyltransferase
MSIAAQNNEAPCLSGLPQQAQDRLLAVLTAQPQVQRIWLFGSRAMGRHQPGSDLDLCLEAPQLSHSDRLRLMYAVDELCLPWQVDLVLHHELPVELEAHVQRVGRSLWTQP